MEPLLCTKASAGHWQPQVKGGFLGHLEVGGREVDKVILRPLWCHLDCEPRGMKPSVLTYMCTGIHVMGGREVTISRRL